MPGGAQAAAGRAACGRGEPGSGAARAPDFEYTAKIRTLAETERFFDELTKEKDQVKNLNFFPELNVCAEGIGRRE